MEDLGQVKDVNPSIISYNMCNFSHVSIYWFLLFHFVYVCVYRVVLLWLFTATCIKTGRPQLARRAIELAEKRLSKDNWPEYYDGKLGRYVGKQARRLQTWSITGYLVAKMMLENPSHLGMVSLDEEKKVQPTLTRSSSF